MFPGRIIQSVDKILLMKIKMEFVTGSKMENLQVKVRILLILIKMVFAITVKTGREVTERVKVSNAAMGNAMDKEMEREIAEEKAGENGSS
jgi:hypothetical protein